MVIANPIYDVVFKRLMENEKVAKFFIATILGETVETVEVKPQEFTYSDEMSKLAVFRLDFIATIKTVSGEYKKILIEIQKARNNVDLMRFRNYLAEQYKKKDKINGVKTALPITTIYILGFKLPEILTPCLKVERNYKDLVENKLITAKSDFVEKLTHDSFIVQVERISGKYQTKLDKLLSIFEQSNFVDDNKIVKQYVHEVDNEDVKLATDILHYAGTEPAERKKIEIEQEAWRSINAMFQDYTGNLLKEIADANKAIDETNKVLDETNKALDEKNKALDETNKALDETNKALDEKDKALDDMAKQLEELRRRLDEK